MADTRKGLNTTLSYMQSGVNHAYQVRTNLITHGMKVLFDESASRTRRAFYPHRLTSAQFVLGIQLSGEDEYKSFSSWMATYAAFILNIDLAFGEFPSMVVSIPSQGFLRKGVPLAGYDWGDHVGAMVWNPQVIFESAGEPLETVPVLSSVQGYSSTADRDVKYFYPTGTQLGGNDVPADGTYTKVYTIQDIINATAAASTLTAGEAGRGYKTSTPAELIAAATNTDVVAP
jgi:hypothetical protein